MLSFTRFFLAVVLCFFWGIAAMAQDQTSLQSLQIPQKKDNQQPMSTQDLLKQMEQAFEGGAQVASEPSNITEKKAPPQKEIEPIEQIEREPVKPVTPKVVKTAPVVKKKTNKKNVKRRAEQKKVSLVRSYIPSTAFPPLPNIKPMNVEPVRHQERLTDYRDLPDNIVITKDIATRVALEVAPPSKSFTVFEGRQYKDRIVYQVTFKTDSGLHDVLVDSQTGDILKK